MTLATAALDLHNWFSWVVVTTTGIAGVWAVAAHRLVSVQGRALWWFTASAHSTVVIQAGLGSWLIAREDLEAPDLHVFYGFAALAAVGIIYSYRHQLREQIYLLYGGGGLFLMGMAIRAMVM